MWTYITHMLICQACKSWANYEENVWNVVKVENAVKIRPKLSLQSKILGYSTLGYSFLLFPGRIYHTWIQMHFCLKVLTLSITSIILGGSVIM